MRLRAISRGFESLSLRHTEPAKFICRLFFALFGCYETVVRAALIPVAIASAELSLEL